MRWWGENIYFVSGEISYYISTNKKFLLSVTQKSSMGRGKMRALWVINCCSLSSKIFQRSPTDQISPLSLIRWTPASIAAVFLVTGSNPTEELEKVGVSTVILWLLDFYEQKNLFFCNILAALLREMIYWRIFKFLGCLQNFLANSCLTKYDGSKN